MRSQGTTVSAHLLGMLDLDAQTADVNWTKVQCMGDASGRTSVENPLAQSGGTDAYAGGALDEL